SLLSRFTSYLCLYLFHSFSHLSSLTFILFFFFNCSGHHRDLHSFPTRRSSDLLLLPAPNSRSNAERGLRIIGSGWVGPMIRNPRSEEHTSELQSRFDLVCRLLLEKKKKKKNKK